MSRHLSHLELVLKGLRRPQCPVEPRRVASRQHSSRSNWPFLDPSDQGVTYLWMLQSRFAPALGPTRGGAAKRTEQGPVLWRATLAGKCACQAGLGLSSSLLRNPWWKREPTPKRYPPISIYTPWRTPKHNPPPFTHTNKNRLKAMSLNPQLGKSK